MGAENSVKLYQAFVNPDGDFTHEAVTNIEGHDYNNGLIYAFKDTDGSMVPVKVFDGYEYIPGMSGASSNKRHMEQI